MHYSNAKVRLGGEDGNAFSVLGRTVMALKGVGAPKSEIQKFLKEATAGNYDHLLGVVMEWVDVE